MKKSAVLALALMNLRRGAYAKDATKYSMGNVMDFV